MELNWKAIFNPEKKHKSKVELESEEEKQEQELEQEQELGQEQVQEHEKVVEQELELKQEYEQVQEQEQELGQEQEYEQVQVQEQEQEQVVKHKKDNTIEDEGVYPGLKRAIATAADQGQETQLPRTAPRLKRAIATAVFTAADLGQQQEPPPEPPPQLNSGCQLRTQQQSVAAKSAIGQMGYVALLEVKQLFVFKTVAKQRLPVSDMFAQQVAQWTQPTECLWRAIPPIRPPVTRQMQLQL